jgi:Ni,Fe-hydrogenase III small subunit
MLQQIRIWLRTDTPRETVPAPSAAEAAALRTGEAAAQHDLHAGILRILGRALAIRVVDAGSCNACELELQALMNPYYNIEGAGIRFVASPRHADLLVVTGPVSRNMAVALRRTYDAMPAPKRVVAAGGCACTGGIFGESYASAGRVANVIPVDVEIPGCPPTPLALMQGILAAVTPAAMQAPA